MLLPSLESNPPQRLLIISFVYAPSHASCSGYQTADALIVL